MTTGKMIAIAVGAVTLIGGGIGLYLYVSKPKVAADFEQTGSSVMKDGKSVVVPANEDARKFVKKK